MDESSASTPAKSQLRYTRWSNREVFNIGAIYGSLMGASAVTSIAPLLSQYRLSAFARYSRPFLFAMSAVTALLHYDPSR